MNKAKDLLSFCSNIQFGQIHLSAGEKTFRDELNTEILALCKSLPKFTRTDALLFFMKYFRASFEDGLDFLRYFYAPAWSTLYYIIQTSKKEELKQEHTQEAKTAHTMAMFLHALDDHLVDQELPVTHLALLLRSQLWMTMSQALYRLADSVPEGYEVVQALLNDYYCSISDSEEIGTLDHYCDRFRKQMATWLIVPVLLTKRNTKGDGFTESIKKAYGSFGIAWRLLDDVQDLEEDMKTGIRSSIYVCLPEDKKKVWERIPQKKDETSTEKILFYLYKNGIVDKIINRIVSELESAASIVGNYGMEDLALELQFMMNPLKDK
jgi:hypothetical protein